MTNGCPKCEELLNKHVIGEYLELCLDCRLEMADWEVSRWMRIREELEKKKEKENELSSSKTG